jgi:hypothetical protein
MYSSFSHIAYQILLWVRYVGIILLTIGGMVILGTEALRSKLSPAKVLGVAASAIIAAVLFWILPDLVSMARSDVQTSVGVRNCPVGGYC